MGADDRYGTGIMKYYLASFILCFFALVKVVADVFGFERLSALAAVTSISPAMKVFTAHKGYETYSSGFELTINYKNSGSQTLRLAPSNYEGLRGPYNRRNVYGALIAYGPLLVSDTATKPMWEEMAHRAFCGPISVHSELGFESISTATDATIRYVRQTADRGEFPDELKISCG